MDRFAPRYAAEMTSQFSGVAGVLSSRQSPVVDFKTKNVSTQTMYRDGESQTDPFSPSYTVTPGTRPEILELAGLTSSNPLLLCFCVIIHNALLVFK